jgi:hypothetical protein
LLESDAVLLLLLIGNAVLLLLLISESVLLSLVAGGAGGGGHLPLTKKFEYAARVEQLWCAVMEPQETPRNNRVQEASCFALLFDLAALREVSVQNSASVSLRKS